MVMYFLIIENFNCLKNLIVWLEDLPLQNYKEKKRTMTDQQYQPKGSQIDPEGLHDYMKKQIDELKAWLEIKTDMAESLQKEVDIEHTRYLQEAIKRGDIQQELADLKEEVEEWKESCSGYVNTPDELEMWMSAAIHEDEEEYSKYMEPLELRDEVKKLKEENEELKETYFQRGFDAGRDEYQVDTEYLEEKDAEIEKLKEENKKLKKKYELSLEQTDKLEEENKNLNKYLAETKIHLCFEEDMKELKAANKTLEDIHSGDMKIVKMLKEKWNEEQEKNKKLKEENKKLAEAAVVIDLSAMMNDPDYEGFDFESEIKKLKEENEDLNKGLDQDYEDMTKNRDKLQEENKKLKEGVKLADNYWRCIMDHLSNPDNPDVNFIKPWASEDGLNEEDTEELLNHFGYYEEETDEEDPTDK